jgi:hypothetical protein
MSPNHRSRSSSFGIVAVFAIALAAPIAVHAEDETLPAAELALAPVPGSPSTTQVPSDVRWAPADTIAPATSVAASRVRAAQQVLLSSDLGSLQEETLMGVVATAMTWDETSGYGSVEASRAHIGHLAPIAGSSWDAITGQSTVRANRRGTALYATSAPSPSWDETSGYGSVEASRAVRVSSSMLPAPSAAPALSDASATTHTSNLFTVSGAGFTAGGRVYLAIYDQMGAQLYETRWITASLPVLAVMGPTGHEAASINGYGGTLRASFANLCGATAMMRGYDQVTTTWSNWLTVEPACAA